MNIDGLGDKIIEDFYKNRPIRYYTDYCPTIRAERIGLKVLYINT